MSSFDGAVVDEQGVTFGIAVARRSVLDNPTARNQAIAEFSEVFGDIPTVLMAQDGQGFRGSLPFDWELLGHRRGVGQAHHLK